MRLLLCLCLAALPGCGNARRISDEFLTLDLRSRGGDVLLTLTPAPGAKINAIARPVLELADGRRITLESPAFTSDSAYYATPPTGLIPGGGRIEGTLRAGVCPLGLSVCRTVTLAVDASFGSP
jgi:hypothetical protein